MNTISFDNGYGTVYTFEIVDRIPEGYEIWNISDDKIKGYLPLCQCYPNTYHIIPETLKAIKMPEEDIKFLHKHSVRYGWSSAERIRKAINRVKDESRRRNAEHALELLEKFS